jgi:hypothetical protein
METEKQLQPIGKRSINHTQHIMRRDPDCRVIKFELNLCVECIQPVNAFLFSRSMFDFHSICLVIVGGDKKYEWQ